MVHPSIGLHRRIPGAPMPVVLRCNIRWIEGFRRASEPVSFGRRPALFDQGEADPADAISTLNLGTRSRHVISTSNLDTGRRRALRFTVRAGGPR